MIFKFHFFELKIIKKWVNIQITTKQVQNEVKTSEEVTINDFKNIIGDEEIYNQVLLIKDKLELCESLEEQVIMLMKNVFLIYSKNGVKQKIIYFEYLFSNCYKSRRVHSIYQKLKR